MQDLLIAKTRLAENVSGNEPPRKWLQSLAVGFVITLSFFSLLAIVIAARSFGFSPRNFHDPEKTFDPATIAAVLAVLTAPIAVVLAGQKWLLRKQITDLGIWGEPVSKLFICGTLTGVAAKVAATLSAYSISNRASLSIAVSNVGIIDWVSYFAWFVFALLLNSFSEELTFRAFPVRNLAQSRLSGIIVIALSATAFSLMHFAIEPPDIYHFLYRLAFGCLAGVLYLRWRSLWLVVGLHTGWNFIALAVNDDDWRTGTILRLVGLREHSETLANIIILLIVAVFVSYRRGKSEGVDLASNIGV